VATVSSVEAIASIGAAVLRVLGTPSTSRRGRSAYPGGSPHACVHHRCVRLDRFSRGPELIGAGHQIVGLARSDASAVALAEAGAESDGVIHLAFTQDIAFSGGFEDAVHRSDAAHLFRLALESAPAGSTLHAVADEGVPIRTVAEVIGRHLGLPVSSA
jgi:hypothetical protein